MNPLEKYPHLFVNGRFKGKVKGLRPSTISAIKPNGNYNSWLLGLRDLGGGQHLFAEPKDTTLIARPIEDMTDKEWEPIRDNFECRLGNYDNKKIVTNALHISTLLHLLSIGVYPFDQSHFEDGTVIDSRTI